jgi:hypothetical protein
VKQIFGFLALLANVALLVTFYLGWRIEDAAAPASQEQFSLHFLFALASSGFVLLVHAIVLTYFMGTGRWIEETSAAYRFEPAAREENIRLKYRVIPGMVACMTMIILTGAVGAVADPASNVEWTWAATAHFTLAVATIGLNILVSALEYRQIGRNTELVNLVYAEVQAVRRERGLDPVPAGTTGSPPSSPSAES